MPNTPTSDSSMRTKAEVFISHITEEADVAAKLKAAIGRDFLGMVDVFASSDSESIAAGEDWLTSIDKALHRATILLTLCSRESKYRPWIHFEAGAAWALSRPIIPLCHAGLTPNDLPMPLSTRQGILLGSAEGLQRLYSRLASELNCRCPDRDFEALARELSSLEAKMDGTLNAGQLDRDRAIQKRLIQALSHPRYRWRSLKRVAIEAAVSEEVAADFLRASDEVRFGKGQKADGIIVGLISRVGSKGY
jgi:TIR domain